MKIKCLVACLNSNGEPELVHTTVECSQDEYDSGEHYTRAKEQVEAIGYEKASWVADQNDPGFIEPPPNSLEMILDAINRADRVIRIDATGNADASFFTGTPEEDDPTATVLGFHDGDLTVADLEQATILADGTGFHIGGTVFRLQQTIPVWIGHAEKNVESDLIQHGPNSQIYSVFVLHDNNTWGQPNFRFRSDKPGVITRERAEEVIRRHFRCMLVSHLAEDPDCAEGTESVIDL